MKKIFIVLFFVLCIPLVATEKSCDKYKIQASCEKNSKCEWDAALEECKSKETKVEDTNDKPVIPKSKKKNKNKDY